MRRPTRRQRLALVLLLLLAVVFVTLDYRGSAFGGARSGAETVFGPVQRGLAAIFTPVGRFIGGIPHVGSARADIDALRRENEDLRRRLGEQSLDRARSEELARLHLLAGLGGYLVVLAADPRSTVGARVAGSDELGLVTGNGTGPMALTLLNPNAQVHAGDRLVTGPYGKSTYVAGVPIGEIVAIGGDTGGAGPRTATVRGYVDLTRLDLVGVVLAGPRTDPRDSVLSQEAAPTATASAAAR